jgi:hypothetical protein
MEDEQVRKAGLKLEQVARSEFGILSRAERILVRAITGPQVAFCGPSTLDDDPGNDPSKAADWDDGRHISADLIRWLCLDHRARGQVDPMGLQVHGAKIIGELNLAYFVIPFPLCLRKCAFSRNADFRYLDVTLLDLTGSWVRFVNAWGMHIKGDVFLKHGFRADGEVRLTGAQIGGNLDCERGEFINPPKKSDRASGIALNAGGISVRGTVLLRRGFHSEGEVMLLDSQISGSLDCAGGKFINPVSKDPVLKDLESNGKALSLNRASIAGNVYLTKYSTKYLTQYFRAEGNVRMLGAHVGGVLDFHEGNFEETILWLDAASAASVRDDERSWPKPGKLSLNGFVYGLIEPRDADVRLKWLSLQQDTPFFPQPYLQLAKILGDAGDDEGRTRVLVAMRDREWRGGGLGASLVHSIFRGTVGYGYRPSWAFWEVLTLSALGWIVYRRSYLAGMMVPTDKDAYESFRNSQPLPSHYRAFVPLVYSLENSLPLVKFGQVEKWQPDPKPLVVAKNSDEPANLGSQNRGSRFLYWIRILFVLVGLRAPEDSDARQSRVSQWCTSPRVIRWFVLIQILLGWLLTTLFLAGITGVIRKD